MKEKQQQTLNLVLPPEVAYQETELHQVVQDKIDLSKFAYHVSRRSIDARSKKVKINIQIAYFEKELASESRITYRQDDLPDVSEKDPFLVVGSGPAGLFASLKLIQLGHKPILLERGNDVQARRRDLANINKHNIVNPHSNYCFGEGGAGTYSDGKLYTRSKKRGDLNEVLEMLVAHGAVEDILIDAHPHIGTNKLPKIIAAMRQTIIDHGGKVHFNSHVTDLKIASGHIRGVEINAKEIIKGNALILATGHSARDIFQLLSRKKIAITPKPFALGVRIEHQQSLIDSIQYHCEHRGDYLPAAAYSLVQQVAHRNTERGVFSFCMCPGGFIVPSATSQQEVVVNGMSPSRRDSKYANSGIVVAIENEDLKPYHAHGALANMEFQKAIEHKAWQVAGQTQSAPAQRMVDFVNKTVSKTLPSTSYQPGLQSVELREVLPPMITERLSTAFRHFGKKMKGYFTNEAQIVGVESRTSSPVKIPRDKESLEHPEIKGLFPCGEGGGYAGGIVSAAIDGMRCAEKAVMLYGKK